jgi:hypothetical protein
LTLAHRPAASGAPLLAGLLTFFPALALFSRTLLTDVGLWDTAEYQTLGAVLGIAHPTGYPAYTLLAWAASIILEPLGEPALRANLLSAILAALGTGLTAAVVTMLTGRAVVGIASGLALAVTAAGWSIALHADAHALHLALAALLLLLLVGWAERERAGRSADRWLIGAAVVFGVSLGNHALTFLLAPGIALYVLLISPGLLRDRLRLVVTCASALALTTVVLYAYLPLRSAMNPPLDYANPETWEGFSYLVFAEQFRGSFHGYPAVPEALRLMLAGTWDELRAFSLLALVGVGITAFRRPQLLIMLSAWFILSWAFALGYTNADIERYRLAPLLSVAVLGGIGAAAIWGGLAAAWRRFAPQRWLAAAWLRSDGMRVLLTVLLAALLLAPSIVVMAGRFNRVDESNWMYGRRWLEAVLPRLEQDAVVVSWWGYSTALWYAQYIEGARPDVYVIDDRTRLDNDLGSATDVIDRYLGQRPVYLIRLEYDLPEYEQRYQLTDIGAPFWGRVYRVEGARAQR